jgi:hypothetical protein
MGEQVDPRYIRFLCLPFQAGKLAAKHAVLSISHMQSQTARINPLSHPLHFCLPFCLRSACRAHNTPALRTHALLPKIRSAPFRRGLLPRDKLGSLSTNRF